MLNTTGSVRRLTVSISRADEPPASELGADYADAWAEWIDSGDAEAWNTTVGDGATAG